MLFYLISQRVPLFLFTPGETHTEVTQTANSVLGFKSKPVQLQHAHDRGKEHDSHRPTPKREKSNLGAGVGWEVESYRGES